MNQRNHTFRIKRHYFNLIDCGDKTLEVRVGYPQILKVKEHDTITFEDYSKQPFDVVRVTRYDALDEMLDNENSQKIIPGVSKYKALEMLQEIYTEDKEALGVYIFELKKIANVSIFSASALAKKNHNSFSILVSKAYSVTDYICKDYPKHFSWYWEKTVPAVLKGTREILVCMDGNTVAGIAFLKNECGEKKICTFLIIEKYRGTHVATKLLEESFKFLGTKKPLISIADYKLEMFKGVIQKYCWEQTQVLPKGYYNNNSTEIVFNGKIE